MAISLADVLSGFTSGFSQGIQLQGAFSELMQQREGRAAQRILGEETKRFDVTDPVGQFEPIQPPGVVTGNNQQALPIQPTSQQPAPAGRPPSGVPTQQALPAGQAVAPAGSSPVGALPTSPAGGARAASQGGMPGQQFLGQTPDETKRIVGALSDREAARGYQTLSEFRAPKARDWDKLNKLVYSRVLEETGRQDLAVQAMNQVAIQQRQGFMTHLKNASLAIDSQQWDAAADEITNAWTFFPNGMGAAIFVARAPDGTVGMYGVPMNEDGTEFDEDAELFKIDRDVVNRFLRTEAEPVEEALRDRQRGEAMEDAAIKAAAGRAKKPLTADERSKINKDWAELTGDAEYIERLAASAGVPVDANRENWERDWPKLKGLAYNRWFRGLEEPGQHVTAEEAIRQIVQWWWDNAMAIPEQ